MGARGKGASLFAATLGLTIFLTATEARTRPLMIVGLDEKLTWDDRGVRVLTPPGRDSVLIVDLARPERPRILARVPLDNSVSGPPVNVAISPDGALALVATAKTVEERAGKLDLVSANKLSVIDLTLRKPEVVQTLEVGSQPSGVSFNPRGTLALVAYAGDGAVGVFKIEKNRLRETGRVDVGGAVSHVAFAPDGRRAIAVRRDSLALLHVDGDQVSFANETLSVGTPYNLDFSPDGKLAVVTNGRSVKSVDLSVSPMKIGVEASAGMGLEGIALSPRGDVAVAVAINGSNIDKASKAYNRNGTAYIYRVAGLDLTLLKQIEIGGVPEAVAFSPDGRYIYAGNFIDQNFSILKVSGSDVIDTGRNFKTPGHPASARISAARPK